MAPKVTLAVERVCARSTEVRAVVLFDQQAFTLAVADLEDPEGLEHCYLLASQFKQMLIRVGVNEEAIDVRTLHRKITP